jgi:hypothetical protein
MAYHFHRILEKNDSKNVFDWKIESIAVKDMGTCIATDYAAKLAKQEENKEIVLTNGNFEYAYLVKSDGSYKSIYNSRKY